MTVEIVENTKYPYRLPVFELDNQKNFSKVVLDTITIDDRRNNVTYNNNSLMFLRKKQTVQNITEGKELIENINLLNPSTTESDVIDDENQDNQQGSSSGIKVTPHYEPEYVMESDGKTIETFNTNSSYMLNRYNNPISLTTTEGSTPLDAPVEIIATRGNVLSLYLEDSTYEPISITEVKNMYTNKTPFVVCYDNNIDEQNYVPEILVNGGHKSSDGTIAPSMELANRFYFNVKDKIPTNNSMIQVNAPNENLFNFTTSTENDGDVQNIAPIASISVNNNDIEMDPFDNSTIQVKFKGEITSENDFGALVMSSKEYLTDDSIQFSFDNIDKSMDNVVKFSHEDVVQTNIKELKITNVMTASPGDIIQPEDPGDIPLPPTEGVETDADFMEVDTFEISEPDSVDYNDDDIPEFVNGTVNDIVFPEPVEEKYEIPTPPIPDEYDPTPYDPVEISCRIGYDTPADNLSVWDVASGNDLNLLNTSNVIAFDQKVEKLCFECIEGKSFTNVKSVVFHENIGEISKSDGSFSTMFPNLEKIIFKAVPKNCKICDMTNLKTVEFTMDVTEFASDFQISGCSNLKHLIIPKIDNLTIPSDAFINNGLELISLPETTKKINYRAFAGNPIKNLVIPDSVEDIKRGVFGNNPNGYCLDGPCFMYPAKLTSMSNIFGENNEQYVYRIVIPNNVTLITTDVFEPFTNLMHIDNYSKCYINRGACKLSDDVEILYRVNSSRYFESEIPSEIKIIHVDDVRYLYNSCNQQYMTNITDIYTYQFESYVDGITPKFRLPRWLIKSNLPKLDKVHMPSNLLELNGPIFNDEYNPNGPFNGTDKITTGYTLEIPASVKTLSNEPFKYWANPPTIPDTVKKIIGPLYDGNYTGETLTLPRYLEVISGTGAENETLFKNCLNLKQVIFATDRMTTDENQTQIYFGLRDEDNNPELIEIILEERFPTFDLHTIFMDFGDLENSYFRNMDSKCKLIKRIVLDYHTRTKYNTNDLLERLHMSWYNNMFETNDLYENFICHFDVTILDSTYTRLYQDFANINYLRLNLTNFIIEFPESLLQHSVNIKEFNIPANFYSKHCISYSEYDYNEVDLFRDCRKIETIGVPFVFYYSDCYSCIFDLRRHKIIPTFKPYSTLFGHGSLTYEENAESRIEPFFNAELSIYWACNGSSSTHIVLHYDDLNKVASVDDVMGNANNNIIRYVTDNTELDYDSITINYTDIYQLGALEEIVFERNFLNGWRNTFDSCLIDGSNLRYMPYVKRYYYNARFHYENQPYHELYIYDYMNLNEFDQIIIHDEYSIKFPSSGGSLKLSDKIKFHLTSEILLDNIALDVDGDTLIIPPHVKNYSINGDTIAKLNKIVFEDYGDQFIPEAYKPTAPTKCNIPYDALDFSVDRTSSSPLTIEIPFRWIPVKNSSEKNAIDFYRNLETANYPIRLNGYAYYSNKSGFLEKWNEMYNDSNIDKKYITKINYADHATEIPDNTFYNLDLNDFVIPGHINKVGRYAFFINRDTTDEVPYRKAIKTIRFENGICKITDCFKLNTGVDSNNTCYDLDLLEIPPSVTSLDSNFGKHYFPANFIFHNSIQNYTPHSIPPTRKLIIDDKNMYYTIIPYNVKYITMPSYGRGITDYPNIHCDYPDTARFRLIVTNNLFQATFNQTVTLGIHLPQGNLDIVGGQTFGESYILKIYGEIVEKQINIPKYIKKVNFRTNLIANKINIPPIVEEIECIEPSNTPLSNKAILGNMIINNDHIQLNYTEEKLTFQNSIIPYEWNISNDSSNTTYKYVYEDDLNNDEPINGDQIFWVLNHDGEYELPANKLGEDCPEVVVLPDVFSEISDNPFISEATGKTLVASPFSKNNDVSLTSIQSNTFIPAVGGCRSTTHDPTFYNPPHITASDGITLTKTDVDNYYANYPDVETITIANGIEEIAKGKGTYSRDYFTNFQHVTCINFPSTLKSIGDYSCENIASLEKINWNNGITYIGYDAFRGCTNLESVTIPSSVTKLVMGVIPKSEVLTKLCLQDGLQFIDTRALECYNVTSHLKSLYIPSTVTTFVSSMFGTDAYQLTNLSYIQFKSDNYNIPTDDLSAVSRMFSYKQMPALVQCDLPNNLKDLVMESRVGKPCVVYKPTKYFDNQFEDVDLGTTSFVIPISVTHIGNEVFKNNTSISQLYIPSSITHCGTNINIGAINLTSIYIQDGASGFPNTPFVMDETFNYLKELRLVQDNFELKEGLLNADIPKSITKLICSDSITTLLTRTFNRLTNLLELRLPAGLKELPVNCITDCSSIINIQYPTNLTRIGGYAFSGSRVPSALMTLPSTVKSIGSGIFENAINLSTLIIPSTLQDTKLSNPFAPGCESLQELIVEEGSSYVNFTSGPLYMNTAITKVYLPDTITYFNYSRHRRGVPIDTAFDECPELSEIHLPQGLTNMNRETYSESKTYELFEGANALKEIQLPPGLVKINQYAFKNCTSLAFIKLPTTLTAIKQQAFWGCSSMISFEIPASVISFGENMLLNTPIQNLSVNQAFCKFDYSIILMDYTTVTKLIVQEDVTSITRTSPFKHFTNVQQLKLPDSLTSLPTSLVDGFANNLSVLEFSSCLESIGDNALLGASNLSELRLPDTVTHIGTKGLAGGKIQLINIPTSLSKLEESSLEDVGLTSIKIPANIQSIETLALKGNNLESLVIPSTVKKVASGALIENTRLKALLCSWDQIKDVGYYNIVGNNTPISELFIKFTQSTELPACAFATATEQNTHLQKVYFVREPQYDIEGEEIPIVISTNAHTYDNCTALSNSNVQQSYDEKLSQMLASQTPPQYKGYIEGILEIANSGEILNNPATELLFTPTVYLPGEHQVITLAEARTNEPEYYFNRAPPVKVPLKFQEKDLNSVEISTEGEIISMSFSKYIADKVSILSNMNDCFGIQIRLPSTFSRDLKDIQKIFNGVELKFFRKVSNNNITELYSFASLILNLNLPEDIKNSCCEFAAISDPKDGNFNLYTFRVNPLKTIFKYRNGDIINDNGTPNSKIEVYKVYTEDGSQQGINIPEVENISDSLKSQAAILYMFEQIPVGYIQPIFYYTTDSVIKRIIYPNFTSYTYNFGSINKLNCRQFISYPNSLPYNQEEAYKGLTKETIMETFIASFKLNNCQYCGTNIYGCGQNDIVNYKNSGQINNQRFEIHGYSGYTTSGDMTIEKSLLNNTPIYITTMLPSSKNTSESITEEANLVSGKIEFVTSDKKVLQETQYIVTTNNDTGDKIVQLSSIVGESEYILKYPYQEIELLNYDEYRYSDYGYVKQFNDTSCITHVNAYNNGKQVTLSYSIMKPYSKNMSDENITIYLPGTIETIKTEASNDETPDDETTGTLGPVIPDDDTSETGNSKIETLINGTITPFIILSGKDVLKIMSDINETYCVKLGVTNNSIDVVKSFTYCGSADNDNIYDPYDTKIMFPYAIGLYPQKPTIDGKFKFKTETDLNTNSYMQSICSDSVISEVQFAKTINGYIYIYGINNNSQSHVATTNHFVAKITGIINEVVTTKIIKGICSTETYNTIFTESSVEGTNQVTEKTNYYNVYGLSNVIIQYKVSYDIFRKCNGNAIVIENKFTMLPDGKYLYTYIYNTAVEGYGKEICSIEYNSNSNGFYTTNEFKKLKSVSVSTTQNLTLYKIRRYKYTYIYKATDYEAEGLSGIPISATLNEEEYSYVEIPTIGNFEHISVSEPNNGTVIVEHENKEIVDKVIFRSTIFKYRGQETNRFKLQGVWNIIDTDKTIHWRDINCEYIFYIECESDEIMFSNGKSYWISTLEYNSDLMFAGFLIATTDFNTEIPVGTINTGDLLEYPEDNNVYEQMLLLVVPKISGVKLPSIKSNMFLNKGENFKVSNYQNMRDYAGFNETNRFFITDNLERLYDVEPNIYADTMYYPTQVSVTPVLEKIQMTETITYPGVPERKYITFYIPNYFDASLLTDDSFKIISKDIIATFQGQTFETTETNIGTVKLISATSEDIEEDNLNQNESGETTSDNQSISDNNYYKLDTFFIPPGNYPTVNDLVDAINDTVLKSLKDGNIGNSLDNNMISFKNTVDLNLNCPKILISTSIDNKPANVYIDWEDIDFRNFKVHLKTGKKYLCILDYVLICQLSSDIEFNFKLDVKKYIYDHVMYLECDIGDELQLKFDDVISSNLVTDKLFYDILINNRKFIEITNDINVCEYKLVDSIIPVRFETEDIPEKIDYLCLIEPNQNFQQEFNTFNRLETFEDLVKLENEFGPKFKQYVKTYFENENFGISFKHNIKNIWYKLGVQPIIINKDKCPYILGPNDILKVLQSGLNIEFNKLTYYNILSSDFVETSYMTDKIKLPHILYMAVDGKKKIFRGEQSLNELRLFKDTWKGEHLPNLDIPDRVLIKTTTNEDIEYILNIGDNETIISETDNFEYKNNKMIIKVYQTVEINKSDKIYIYIDSEEHYPFVVGVNARLKVEWIK